MKGGDAAEDHSVRQAEPLPVIEFREVAPLLCSLVTLVVLLIPGLDHASVIGVIASVLAFAVFIPQAARVWSARNDHHALLGVSITTNMFIINNSIVWFIYAWTVGEFFVGAAGIINLPLAGMIVAVIVRSRLIRRRTTSASDKADEQADLPNLGGSIMTYTAEDFAQATLAKREALLSDETVERAARALLAYEEGANGITWEVLGEYERDVHLNAARVVLTAAIGDDDE